jgi:uracil-DNA glycosylase family 4
MRRATGTAGLADLERRIVACRACPRLCTHREEVARSRRRAFREEVYWGRPVPGFGDPRAHLVVIGLAPAAHGANRTGRMFTGDRSGDFLYAALHRAGFANRPASSHRGDGLRLRDCRVSAVVRCAPPRNRPTPEERDRCAGFLIEELALLRRARVLLCLGGFALDGTLRALRRSGCRPPSPRPRFAHGALHRIERAPAILCSYHPSQQNTFTGRLTPRMLDEVLGRARSLCEEAPAAGRTP